MLTAAFAILDISFWALSSFFVMSSSFLLENEVSSMSSVLFIFESARSLVEFAFSTSNVSDLPTSLMKTTGLGIVLVFVASN